MQMSAMNRILRPCISGPFPTVFCPNMQTFARVETKVAGSDADLLNLLFKTEIVKLPNSDRLQVDTNA